jgi:phasin family protein
MFSFQEQFTNNAKAAFESQLAAFHALAAKAFEGTEKVIALNLAATKASVQESTASAKQLFAAKDAKEFFAVAASQAKPAAEKATSYGRHLGEIVSAIQAEFAKTTEAQIAEAKASLNAAVDAVAKNAPAGSESAVVMLKSVVANANTGYEQLSTTIKQNVEKVEAHVTKAADQFTQAAEKAVNISSKK